MSLPSLKDLSALDLLRLMDSREENVMLLAANRLAEGRPIGSDQSVEEWAWLYQLRIGGGRLQELLAEMSFEEAYRRLSEGREEKKAGAPRDWIYLVAWDYEATAKRTPTEVFDELVWPTLLATGAIKPDASGQLDESVKKASKKAYFSARQRLKK